MQEKAEQEIKVESVHFSSVDKSLGGNGLNWKPELTGSLGSLKKNTEFVLIQIHLGFVVHQVIDILFGLWPSVTGSVHI